MIRQAAARLGIRPRGTVIVGIDTLDTLLKAANAASVAGLLDPCGDRFEDCPSCSALIEAERALGRLPRAS